MTLMVSLFQTGLKLTFSTSRYEVSVNTKPFGCLFPDMGSVFTLLWGSPSNNVQN